MGLQNENAYTGHQRPWVCFDIETVPMPNCAEYLTEPIDAPSNYKDEAKIKAYIDNKRTQQITDAGLDIDLCEVAAIAWERSDGQALIYLRNIIDEATMLRDFWRAVEGYFLVGFNVLHFDLLVLLRRSLYLGVSTPKLSVDKYRHDTIIDLADVLSFGRRDLLRSLSFYAKRLGIDHDDTVSGADITALVAAGDWQAVSAHVYDDVQTTKAIAHRLGVIVPRAVQSEVAV